MVALGVLLNACKEPLAICNYNFVYGLTILVTDSATGSPLGGAETIVEIREGTYVDTLLELSGVGEYSGAGERAGTYSVKVQRVGYRVRQIEGVRVREDECHVIPVRVDVRLQAF